MPKATKAKFIEVELPDVEPKGKVDKFVTEDKSLAMRNAYVSKEAVAKLGGCEDGIKITIEAL